MAGVRRISLHGGHSGEFCDHARDSLADIVAAYHRAGFDCIGLTEHMPPVSNLWLYPDERALGRDSGWMRDRFGRYVLEARRLAGEYEGRMRILVGMEAEWYPGCVEWVDDLREEHGLDYIVGSVHHAMGVGFDFSAERYALAVAGSGSHVALYCAYFDAQLEMLRFLRPAVVGHFDLIRIYDPDYRDTLNHPLVWTRIVRNLEMVRDMGVVLDVNVRALLKGQPEPYVAGIILDKAAAMGIMAAYGDDAHGVSDVGCFWDLCAERLLSRNMAISVFEPFAAI